MIIPIIVLNCLSAWAIYLAYSINRDDVKSGLYAKDDPHPIWIMTPFAFAAPTITIFGLIRYFFPL